MKDNLHQVVEYTIDAPGQADVLRRGTVTHYSEDGTIIYIADDLGEGKTSARQMPVGQFWVRKVIQTLPAPNPLVAAGLAPDPAAVDPTPLAERRLSSSPMGSQTRRSMGSRPAREVAGAAGPDEFAEPK
jgi:hypothetical protein